MSGSATTQVDPERVAAVFAGAVDLEPAALAAYLDEACAGDARLRAEVESLLRFDGLDGPESESPATIGRFAVIGKLGEGGMGFVYRARDPALDREVALKVVHPARGSADGRARLLREAQAMARVAHPNVVAVYEVGVYGHGVYIAMELVPGETLSSWLRREPRAPRDVLEKLAQAGRGLAAAHEASVLHRDFKPENVLVGEDGRARVLDFGLARAVPESRGESPARSGSVLDSPLTELGAIVGTPSYMSPEHFSGEVSPASDQWSLCVTLYRALFKRPPFEADDILQLRAAVTTGEPTPPSPAEVGDLPPSVVAAMMRGLRRDPAERWPSVADLVDAIEAELRVDPSRSPAAFRRQRRAGAVALTLPGFVNLLALGYRTGFRFDGGVRAVLVQSGVGLGFLALVAILLRRALRSSAYNRHVLSFFFLALATPTVHRVLALRGGIDVVYVLRSDAVFSVSLAMLGALTIDRWIAWPAILFTVYLLLSFVAPVTAVPGYGMALIFSAAIGVWSWREIPHGALLEGRSRSGSRRSVRAPAPKRPEPEERTAREL